MTSLDLRLTPNDRAGGSPGGRGAGRRPVKPATRGSHGRGAGKPPRRRRRRGLFGWLFLICLWAGLAGAGFVGWHAMHLPRPDELAVPDRPANVMVVAADGTMLGNRGETGGEAVRLFELPAHLPQAVIAIEDRRFYSHFGIDPLGLGRALVSNLVAGEVVQGGSTITQQLAKNLFLEPDRTLRRKIQEAVFALWLEHEYSKDEILEMYLNRVYLGAGATGVEAAARVYYDKSAREVTLAEAAMIAGLLKAPSRYAPTNDPQAAANRAATVLSAMVEAGFITPDKAEAARAAPAEVKASALGSSSGYVADWVMELVPSFVGVLREDVVVETTIDARLQRTAETALRGVIDEQGAERGVSEGAVVALEPDGAVRALVGGRNYVQSQFNRAVKAKRQPGSAFKPFVYLAAIEAGMGPQTLRRDAPITIGDWSPGNYAGDYRGPVTLTEALKDSINTVAVRLASEVGVAHVTDVAHQLGIVSPLGSNLSIALGTAEVTPLELVAAYAPFANGGHAVVPHVITRIRTVGGDVLYERRAAPMPEILSQETVGAMNYMMRQTMVSGTGRSAAFGGWPAAGKTGTSQEFRDAWFIGYTSELVAGVWLGNDSNAPTKRVTGGSLPGAVWQKVMEAAHEGVAIAELPGHYVPGQGEQQIVVDRSLPWLADGQRPATARMADPSVPVQPASQQNGPRFPIDGGFLKRLFGG